MVRHLVNIFHYCSCILVPHRICAGGDWGLQRTGAVYLEGTEGTLIQNVTFIRLDGNALFLSDFNRYVVENSLQLKKLF